MNSDFRVSTTFFDHPKTIRLLTQTGPTGVFCLVKLWAWAAIHSPDGDLSELTKDEIMIVSGAHDWAECGVDLIDAWVEYGFLEGDEGSYSLRNWSSRQPWVSSFPKRSRVARLGGLARSKAAKRDEKGRLLPANPADTQPGVPKLDPAPSPSPSPSPKKTQGKAVPKSLQPDDSTSGSKSNGGPPDGFSRWWDELRPWFKAANRRLAYKRDAEKTWKDLKCEPFADKIIERTRQQRSHYLDAQRSGQKPPPPQDPHRFLKNRRFNDEIP